MHDSTTGREGPGAEQGAQEAFARTHLVIDALPRAIVVTDLHGIIVGWNRAATELLGWSSDEVIGHPVLAAVAPGVDRSQAAEAVAGAEVGGRWEGDLVLRTRAGEDVQVHSYISPLRDEHGTIVGVVGASEDVTERREMERWAAELTDHLVLALSAGELGTFRWDMASGATHWDPALERLFGLEPGTFPGTYDAWVAMLHPDDRDEVVAVVERAVAERTSYVIDHRVVWLDGSVHWLQGRGKVTVDEHGQVSGTIGCTADITARRLAELAAEQRAADAMSLAEVQRRERQRLQFLTDLTEAVLTTDSHQSFLAAVARRAVPELGDWCSIHFFPDEGGLPEVEVAHADPARVSQAQEIATRFPDRSDGPMGVPSVMRTGRTEYVPWIDEEVVRAALAHVDDEDLAEIRQLVEELQLCSVITVPLRSRRRSWVRCSSSTPSRVGGSDPRT